MKGVKALVVSLVRFLKEETHSFISITDNTLGDVTLSYARVSLLSIELTNLTNPTDPNCCGIIGRAPGLFFSAAICTGVPPLPHP